MRLNIQKHSKLAVVVSALAATLILAQNDGYSDGPNGDSSDYNSQVVPMLDKLEAICERCAVDQEGRVLCDGEGNLSDTNVIGDTVKGDLLNDMAEDVRAKMTSLGLVAPQDISCNQADYSSTPRFSVTY